MKNEEKEMSCETKKKEKKGETFMFRLTDSDEAMLQELSVRLDRSRSDVVRRAIKLFYYAMEDQD